MFRSLMSFFGRFGGDSTDLESEEIESQPESDSLEELPDEELLNRYHKAGLVYGEAMDEHHVCGLPDKEDLHRWRDLEGEVARRGYRTLSIDAFMRWAGWGRVPSELGVKCLPEEEPVRHSLILIEHLLPELEAAHVDFARQVLESKDGFVQGVVLMPSTEGWLKGEDDRGG